MKFGKVFPLPPWNVNSVCRNTISTLGWFAFAVTVFEAILCRSAVAQTTNSGNCTVAAYIESSPNPNPARVGDDVIVRFSARPADPRTTAECALTSKSCTWAATKIEFRSAGIAAPIDVTDEMKPQIIGSGDGVEAPGEIIARNFPAGYWNVTIRFTASWVLDKKAGCPDCDCGGCEGATAEISFSFAVVGVKLIIDTDDDPEGDNPDDTGRLQKFVDLPFQLRAIPEPSDAEFPAGSPTWKLEGRPGSSFLQSDLGIGPLSIDITPDVEGAYTISAFCGTGKSSIIIDASDVRISALYYQLPSGEWRLVSRGEWLLQGTLVSFKAISNTPDKAFPPGKPVWGGAAAGKNGSIVNVNFDVLTADPLQPTEVTATCKLTQTASYVICKLEGLVSPEIHFPFRSETRVGIGESVALNSQITPKPPKGWQPFQLMWKLNDLSVGDVESSDNNDGKGEYHAGLVPSSIIAPKVRLVILDGQCKGQMVGPFTLTVVAPEDAFMARVPGSPLWHDSLNPSVGFLGFVYLVPDDVSFKNIRFREGGGTCKSDGGLEAGNGKVHKTADWSAIEIMNEGEGKTNRAMVLDRVSVQCPPFGPKIPGSLDWPIEWEYEGVGGIGVRFTIARMLGTIDTNLTATVQKAGAGPFSAANGPPDSMPTNWLLK